MTLHSGTSCNRDAMEILAGIIIILTHAVAVNNDCGISFLLHCKHANAICVNFSK